MCTDEKISVVIAGAHKMMCEGLGALFDKQGDIAVVGQSQNGEKAVNMVKKLKPNVFIVDVKMPGMDGAQETKKIVKEVPQTRVIGLTMYPNKTFITEMLEAGAQGYVLKTQSFQQLAEGVRKVAAGQVFLCPQTKELLIDDYVCGVVGPDQKGIKRLTHREKNVLKMLAEGKSSKEIALMIGMSVKTVDACRRELMRKLEINSIAELVKYAIRIGLTDY